MNRFLRLLPALGAFFVLAVVLAACGDSVPGNAVARVGDETIPSSTFEHWMKIAAISTQGAQSGGSSAGVVVPNPPGFARCVADKRKSAPKLPKGQPTPTAAQLKQQCKQEYESLRDQVMQFLISAQWIQGEAADRGVKVSAKEVDTQFQQTKKQSFPKEADFKKFLAQSGMSLSDIKFRVMLDTLSNKLREKVVKGKDDVTKAEIASYYEKNKARFAQPQRRDLRIVLTKSKGRAQAARSALRSGTSWKKVAKRYSTDQASKSQGGALPGVAKGQQEQALDAAVFSAKKGRLTGPVKTQFGYYVFEVGKITPASQQTLAQASASIKQLLAAQGQQKALDSFVKSFRDKWKGETNCQDGFIVADCKNAPKQSATTAVGQPGQGQQAPPQGQQAPPQGQQAPPQGQQAPPQGQQAPPQGQQAPPQGQQAPPQGQQAPPQGQQAPPPTP